MDKEIAELEAAIERIWEIGLAFGLDPFPTNFEIVPATVMYEVGSYALPGRYSHWTFGKAYHRMKTMYDFGLSRIYEVVINSNPSYGFLLETNSPLQNKLVVAHVMGHVDFFKNNVWFSHTNRRMVDDAATHSRRIVEYEFKHGRKVVERFLDAVLSIEEHVDPNVFIKRDAPQPAPGEQPRPRKEGRYDDLLAPDERSKAADPADAREDEVKLPEKDLLYFIAKYSPSLEPWQRDVVSMIREEMIYFVPQMQTKTANEGWACATGDSLVVSDIGLVRFDELYGQTRQVGVAADDAGRIYPVTDFHKEEQVPTIRIRTRRGLSIEGAHKHRVRLADGRWAYLDEIQIGDRVQLSVGANVWAARQPRVDFKPASSFSYLRKDSLAAAAASGIGNSRLGTDQQLVAATAAFRSRATVGYRPGKETWVSTTRRPLHAPERIDEDAAWLLGYFVGDGHVTKSGVGFTTGDESLKDRLSEILMLRLGLRPRVHWDPTETGGRWRVIVHSRELLRWLDAVGIDLTALARGKKVPDLILRSPKSIVAAFLRGYFDADAYAGPVGVILSSASKDLIHTVQLLLLNFGILSTQKPTKDGCIQLHVKGASATRFLEQIDFGLGRKRAALRAYVEGHRWFRKEDPTDEIVSIEYGRADVYDITVDEKHAYVANGFVNHNSFWHSRIMRELDLPTHEHLEFAELHAGVVSPHPGQLNPYFVGYKILEDIEKRYGRERLFEVREVENDVSLLRNYLTEELCEELDLFVFELVDGENWTVTEKLWERVRDQLVANMTNFGFPYIEVADGDYHGNRELYLRHRYEGTELDVRYAEKTLEHCHRLWGRPVHLETVVDDEPHVLHYDGSDHTEN